MRHCGTYIWPGRAARWRRSPPRRWAPSRRSGRSCGASPSAARGSGCCGTRAPSRCAPGRGPATTHHRLLDLYYWNQIKTKTQRWAVTFYKPRRSHCNVTWKNIPAILWWRKCSFWEAQGGGVGVQLLEYIYTKGPPITAGPTKGATPADKGTRYVVERTDYIFFCLKQKDF